MVSLAFAYILINRLKVCKLEVDCRGFFIVVVLFVCFLKSWLKLLLEMRTFFLGEDGMGGLRKGANMPGSGSAAAKHTEVANDSWLHYQDARVGFVHCPRCFSRSTKDLERSSPFH